MKNKPECFIGITTWNSELFLPICLKSIQKTLPKAEVVILDNYSNDGTQAIANKFNVRCLTRRSSQPQALNILAKLSRSPYTVLIHADVVFLSQHWAEICISNLTGNTALISPEDIGCGPYTRLWGVGKPESSFMFFKTQYLKHISILRRYQRFRIPYFRREIDFYGDHITYNLPDHLASAGLNWFPMKVHVSDRLEDPYYFPPFQPRHWSDNLGYLRYGLGNFYSIDGNITHYHNWYDRVPKSGECSETETADKNGNGVPISYVHKYTSNFINDYQSGRLVIPQMQQD